jgi:hypothetical protein
MSWWVLAAALQLTAGPDLVKVLDRVMPDKSREILVGPQVVNLAPRVMAHTVVFRHTRWELKSMPQSATMSSQMERDAMELPPEERLKVMNRIDDHVQFWVVELKQSPRMIGGIKALLKPLALPHESYRELVCLGQDGSLVWYGYLPIYEWVVLQEKLGLREGDDPLAAAIRGLGVEDRGSMTANSVSEILARAGVRSLPYLKPLIDGTNFWRGVSVLSTVKEPEAEAYLVELAQGPRAEVARVVRHYLEYRYCAAALPLYLKWLDADAGRGEVYPLLVTLAERHPEKLRPWLARIMDAPSTFREYRLAFEISRKLDNSGLPPGLLRLEQDIRKFGYRSGTNYNQAKIDALADELARAGDVAAAAVIAVDLAVAVTKGDWTPVNRAGWNVLNRLPGGQGMRLLEHLQTACRDSNFKESLRRQKLAAPQAP